jgi:SAM-dependent methyltransferase
MVKPVDPRAAGGFAAAADAYQRGRPSYPARAIAAVVDAFDLTAASTVLDLAAGTGQLTRLLRPCVGTVIAVEPAAAMRDRLAADMPDGLALDGTAEDIPLADHAVDAVVVGEAFHWFETAEAAREIARVLTDDGGLALLWNVPTWTIENTPWLGAFREIVAAHRRAAGGYPAGGGSWREPLDRTSLFAPITHVQATHVQRLSCDDFVAQVASWSWIANLPDDERRAVLTSVRELMRAHPQICVPYRTDLYWTRRATNAAMPSSSGPRPNSSASSPAIVKASSDRPATAG